MSGMFKQVFSKFQNFSLHRKMNLTGLFIIILFSLIVYFFIIPYFEKNMLEERKGKLRAVVNSIVSLMDHYERSLRLNYYENDIAVQAGTGPHLTAVQARQLLLETVSRMRYDKTEYFFILNGNGEMIMHPLKPELVGQNMLDVKDPRGCYLFREMVINSQRDSETFVNYIWQSKYSSVIFEPQTTYAKYYWPWDWVVCSGLYTQDIIDSMRLLTMRSIIYEILAAIIALLFLFLIVYFSLSRPLRSLLFGIREIHNGNLDYQLKVSSQDDIGYISREFNLMVRELKASREHMIDTTRLENEMKIAEQIQTGILPKKYAIPGYQICAYMKTAEEVGGDYYDILRAANNSFWINIGDVTGHGVTAGLIMLMLQTAALTAITHYPDITPDQLAILCNKIIWENVKKRLALDQYITFCFYKFYSNGNFEYAGAHEDFIIYRSQSKKAEVIKTEGIWLGILKEISANTLMRRFKLEKNDLLFLYTDGLIEIKNRENEQYDLRRLVNFITRNGDLDYVTFAKKLISELSNFKEKQVDDISFVVIKKRD